MTRPDQVAVPQPSMGQQRPDDAEVLLIRHGRSADVVPGSTDADDPPLHHVGVAQAAALDQRLAGLTLHAVYSSHLRRARDTAAPLAARRGFDTGIFEDLEEVKLGDWGGGEFRRRAAIADPEFLAWAATGRWDDIPGGEGDAAFRQRVSTVIGMLAQRHRGERIAVVAHGGTINAYVAHLFGIHRTHWASIDNTSITTVRIGTIGPVVVGVNDVAHLRDLDPEHPASLPSPA